MTYIPTRLPTAMAGPLTDADTVVVTQAGITRNALLSAFKAFVIGSTGATGTTGGATGSTGTTGGSTGTTGATGSTGGMGGLHTYPEGTSGPYGGIGDTGMGAGPQAYLYGRSLGDLFGTYTYPNPGGTDQNYTLKQTQDKLISITGVKPKTMNAFINNAYDSINRTGDGTFAYGWHNDDATISGPNGYLRPIIGLKMHGWNDAKGNRDTFIDIQNGVYDSLYLSEMNTWIGFGYKHLVYRLAYEFNGTFMPDYFGSDTATNADFAAAMRHLILLMKNRASQAGIKAEFTFNPSYINGIDTDVMNGWPGDDVIDIIDTDQYNSCYPRYKAGGFLNFDANGAPLGTYEQSQSTWILNPNNRKKFWNYPGIKDNYPPDIHDYDPGGWSTLRAIAIAKAKGKPIAFSECGTGGGSNTDAFFNNDPTWVRWFWQTIQSAISQGVSVAHINIWNIYADDGRWEYSAPDSYDPQPDVALAYRKYFGDGAFAGGPTPVSGDGTVPSIGGGSTGSTGSSGGGSTGASTGSATAVVTDTSGHTATITLPVPPAAGEPAFYGSDTGLSANMYYYSNNGQLTLGCSAPGVIASIALNRNGNNIIVTDDLAGVTTYSGSPSGSTGSTSGSSGVATVQANDNSGHSATITLNAGYRTYYQNETGLALDIYFYADTGNGNKPTVGSSADGHVSSMLITRDGTGTVSSPGLAGVTTYA